ncbi:MAG: aldo/keto reductase [Rhodocyclaceae bacterium]|nr:aldo/keto reductase [Rhodocyclaceae bacterium]
MRYRTLGRTGIKVSPYCLGAMMFGKGGNPDRDECIRMIRKSRDFGINFIDTADAYSHGMRERRLLANITLKGMRLFIAVLKVCYFSASVASLIFRERCTT